MLVGERYVSRRTAALLIGGLALLAVVAVVGLTITRYLPPGRVEAALALTTDVGAMIFGLLAATALFTVARRFRPGNPLRQVWLLLATGVAVYALGDVVWTVLDVRSGFGQVPYPSLADALYLALYVFLGAGILRTAQAFQRSADVRKPMMVSIGLTVLASFAAYAFIAAPVFNDPATSLFQKVLGVVYPMADIAVLLGPALFIALAAGAVGRSHAALQWWVLAFGLAVMSVSDIGFTWLDWTGRYVAGHPVDFGWMLSLLLIALAGSLSADAVQGQKAHTRAAE